MRPILVALVLAASSATAQAGTGEERTAGTLTCTVVQDASLVFGDGRPALCTFEGRGASQSYAAMLPPRAGSPRTLKWRVLTAEAANRPGLLKGRFTGDGEGLAGKGFAGKGVRLAPMATGPETAITLRPVGERAAASLLTLR